MSLKKRAIRITTLALIGVLVSTPLLSTVSAMEKNNTLGFSEENYISNLDSYEINLEDQKILESYNEDAINSIANESLSNLQLKSDNGSVIREKRAAGSIATKIAKKFGKKYLTHQLPKMIYKKLPSAVTKKVSESAFVGGWNTYVLMGPLDDVKDNVTDWLVGKGVWKWAANSAGYIAQGVIWALI